MVVTEPLLTPGRHNASYGVAPEEDLRILKLKSEVKFLTMANYTLMFLILALVLSEVYSLYNLYMLSQSTDLLVFGNNVKYPFLVVDENTRPETLKSLPLAMVFQRRAA